ncbi:hypothetical protein OHA21_21870 [Actinoplanes sp. NBC_00393]|uniref:hypothetical protein n=1 Tax=Actinoplanes sp. NBC_00393 TaxID=2975953 RepID=UPI002E24095E
MGSWAPPYPDDPTTATRHLCAGAYLDERFRDTALREVYHRPARAVALSYGYSLTPVLAHCLRARSAALLRDTLIITVLLIALCATPLDAPAATAAMTLVALLVCSLAWSLWRQAQLDRFRPGRTPAAPTDDQRLRDIDLQQYGNTVVHSGHRQFLGAGPVVGTWNLTEPLGPGPVPFDAAEVVAHLQWHLGALVGGPGTVPEETIAGLTVTDRVHLAGTEVGRLDPVTPPGLVAEIIRRPTAAARHYLACQIPSRGGEVVTTVHVHVAVQGGVLYLEVTTTALMPCPDAYHVVDLPDASGPRAWLRAVGDGVATLPVRVVRAPLRLVRALGDAVPDRHAFIRRPHRGPSDLGRILRVGLDHGARVAVRELAGGSSDHTRYPDIAKHRGLIERQVLDAVRSLLEAHAPAAALGPRPGSRPPRVSGDGHVSGGTA